ncbi:hypothetical protein [Nocardioides sp.]|uniref:hypothetical protein n=1 Tax=Nocardioides sp. TaxID=35761 RepID=UPI0027323D5D|nr:hypothetical protein [Nocardioides sp.]MDP3890816.1 hypothetical protein [Nocardioides sp.]
MRMGRPDSHIARRAEMQLRATSEPSLVNHCLRSHLWGVALAELEHLDHDPELLFVAAALHDLGLVSDFDTGAPFEVDSAAATHRFALSHDWDGWRAREAGTAVELHVAPEVTLDHGVEAYLLWHATSIDVSGHRLEELPSATVTRVLAAHPWLDFTGHFGQLLGQQAEQKPTSRAGQLVDGGLLTRLAGCPLGHLVPGDLTGS